MPFVRGTWMRGVAVSVAAIGLMGAGRMLERHAPPLGGNGGPPKATVGPVTARRPQIGVNGYLWRATLDTLSFMPLASADPYGGVVITDWYTNPEKPDRRFKIHGLHPGCAPAG